jgi:hypothetical protein
LFERVEKNTKEILTLTGTSSEGYPNELSVCFLKERVKLLYRSEEEDKLGCWFVKRDVSESALVLEYSVSEHKNLGEEPHDLR